MTEKRVEQAAGAPQLRESTEVPDRAADEDVEGHLWAQYYGAQVEGRWAGRAAGDRERSRVGEQGRRSSAAAKRRARGVDSEGGSR